MDEREAFKVNKESHLRPIFATKVTEQLQGNERMHSGLLRLIEKECKIPEGSIVDFDLNLVDTQVDIVIAAGLACRAKRGVHLVAQNRQPNVLFSGDAGHRGP